MIRRSWLALALLAVGCEQPATIDDPSVAITPLRLPPVELEEAGGAVAIDQVQGPIVLHFWATWCAPCRRELPGLLRLADEVHGVRVIAVTDEPLGAVRTFFAPDAVPRWIACDERRVLARALGVGSLPDTYLVDAEGVARRRVAGSLDWDRPSIRAWVEWWVLGEPP